MTKTVFLSTALLTMSLGLGMGLASITAVPVAAQERLAPIDSGQSYVLAQARQFPISELTRRQSRDVQLVLQDDGYSPGVADGVIGTRTKRAIAAWAADRGLGYRPGFIPSQLFTDSVVAAEERPASGGGGSTGGGGGSCGWYAIYGCNSGRGSANSTASRYGGYVINTSSSSFPNFNPGFYCAVDGPSGKAAAETRASRARSRGASSAYVKNAC